MTPPKRCQICGRSTTGRKAEEKCFRDGSSDPADARDCYRVALEKADGAIGRLRSVADDAAEILETAAKHIRDNPKNRRDRQIARQLERGARALRVSRFLFQPRSA